MKYTNWSHAQNFNPCSTRDDDDDSWWQWCSLEVRILCNEIKDHDDVSDGDGIDDNYHDDDDKDDDDDDSDAHWEWDLV